MTNNFLTFEQWKIKSGLVETFKTCLTCDGTGMSMCGCLFGACKECKDSYGEVPCPDCDEVGKTSNLPDLYEAQRRHDRNLIPKLMELTNGNNNNR